MRNYRSKKTSNFITYSTKYISFSYCSKEWIFYTIKFSVFKEKYIEKSIPALCTDSFNNINK